MVHRLGMIRMIFDSGAFWVKNFRGTVAAAEMRIFPLISLLICLSTFSTSPGFTIRKIMSLLAADFRLSDEIFMPNSFSSFSFSVAMSTAVISSV